MNITFLIPYIVYNKLKQKKGTFMKKFTFALLFASLLSFAHAADDIITVTTVKNKTLNIIGTDVGLNIKEYQDKVVFLEFFGHRCPPCIKSIPHYIKLQEKYKDKLAIVAIEVQGLNNTALKKFVEEKGINYAAISQEKAGSLVPYISKRAQWEGAIPFLIVLDPKGEVQLVQAGMLPETTLEKLILKLSK